MDGAFWMNKKTSSGKWKARYAWTRHPSRLRADLLNLSQRFYCLKIEQSDSLFSSSLSNANHASDDDREPLMSCGPVLNRKSDWEDWSGCHRGWAYLDIFKNSQLLHNLYEISYLFHSQLKHEVRYAVPAYMKNTQGKCLKIIQCFTFSLWCTHGEHLCNKEMRFTVHPWSSQFCLPTEIIVFL